MIIHSYSDGKILHERPNKPLEDAYGSPHLLIHRAALHKALAAEALRLGVTIQLDSKVSSVSFVDPPSLTLSSGAIQAADIILGADGLHSTVRSAFGHLDPPQLTGQIAYRFLVPAAKLFAHDELRKLIENGSTHFWPGPDSHVVCYQIKEDGLLNVVLLCPDNMGSSEDIVPVTVEEASERVRGWDPRLTLLVELANSIVKWRLYHSTELATWVHPTAMVALLGDACHATLPYLAQGAALAIEDGFVLGLLFAKLSSKPQLPEILRIYEDLRKPRTSIIVQENGRIGHIQHLPGEGSQHRIDRMSQMEVRAVEPNISWTNPDFRKWVLGYDGKLEVEKAWEARFKDGSPQKDQQ